MKLVIDVGNTNVVMGIYEENKLLEYWRLSTSSIKTADEVGMFISVMFTKWKFDVDKVNDVIVTSVVPNIMYSLTHGVQKYLNIEPKIVSVEGKTGLNFNKMANPAELGADRIVNCIAGYNLYGGPIVVVDYGTASTYDAVDKDGNFVTGITAPGLKLTADALFAGTALLGKVAILKPDSILATDTITSIQSGLVYGHIGQSEYIISKIKEELGDSFKDAKIVATGGLSKVVSEGTDMFDVVDSKLTLYGTKLYGDMN
ncbi:MAG: type III pantothenate kinase [Lachnospirales bacterium]